MKLLLSLWVALGVTAGWAATVDGPAASVILGDEARKSPCATSIREILNETLKLWEATEGVIYVDRVKYLGPMLEAAGVDPELATKASQVVAAIMTDPAHYPVVRSINRWMKLIETETQQKHPEYQFLLCLMSNECHLMKAPKDNRIVTRKRPDRKFRTSPKYHRDRAHSFATPYDRMYLLKHFPSAKEELVTWVIELLGALAAVSEYTAFEHWAFGQMLLEEEGKPTPDSLIPSLVNITHDGRMLVDPDLNILVSSFRRDLLAEAVYRKWFIDDPEEAALRLKKLAKRTWHDFVRSGNAELLQVINKLGIKSSSDYLLVAKQTIADFEGIISESGTE